MTRILFVCMGNICRSPLAAAALRFHASASGLRIEAESAGTHDYHVGEGADTRAVAAGSRRGYELVAHRARQIVADDFARYDYLLAMDRANLARLQQMAPEGGTARAVLFLEFAGIAQEGEVPDPYYGGTEAFERALDLIDAATAKLLARLAGSPLT